MQLAWQPCTKDANANHAGPLLRTLDPITIKVGCTHVVFMTNRSDLDTRSQPNSVAQPMAWSDKVDLGAWQWQDHAPVTITRDIVLPQNTVH